MVARQLEARGIRDQRVLAAMRGVPRELFVPERERGRAYADQALPIGCGQTISQPWIVAAIASALELTGEERVLEVGTGSGYSTAVLARLCAEVISVERIGELAAAARLRLEAAGISNVEVMVADGSVGVAERAPFDAIAVHAAVPAPPPSLLSQLAPGGRLVAPVEVGNGEQLTLFRRSANPAVAGFERLAIAPCRFVPLLGAEGYPEP